MLSKEQAENFSALTSSPTVVRDTVPEDAFGSTALATANEMIDAAGEDIFHYNYRDWYGLGPDTVTLWTEFLNGDLTADEAREREQDRSEERRVGKGCRERETGRAERESC